MDSFTFTPYVFMAWYLFKPRDITITMECEHLSPVSAYTFSVVCSPLDTSHLRSCTYEAALTFLILYVASSLKSIFHFTAIFTWNWKI